MIYVATALALMLSSAYRDQFTADTSASGVGDSTGAIVGAVVFLLVGAAVDGVLAWAVLRGHNWARIWLMSVSVFSTALAFLSHAAASPGLSPKQLVPVAGSILVLLALSSHASREYAARRTAAPRRLRRTARAAAT